jgi:hypothetical protein
VRRVSLFLLLGLTWAAPAPALPVDWVHDVEPGREKFVKLPKLDWFEVENPQVAQVEWMGEAGELVLSGLKPGRTLVLLGAEGKVAVWRVRVGGKPEGGELLLAAAKKACPGLTLTPAEDIKLAVTVKDDACRTALLELFRTDAVEARALEVTWEGKALQAQLKSLQQGLDAVARGKASARYVGAGLVLEGTLNEAQHRAVLWELFRRSVGRLALDDRIILEALDAGTARSTLPP